MGLIMRRNLMAGKPLPYLRRVEYLESHGTEWIDLDIKSDSRFKVSARCSILGGGLLFGTYVSPYQIGLDTQVANGGARVDGVLIFNVRKPVDGTVFEFELSKERMYCNNIEYGSFSDVKDFYDGSEMYLFAANGQTQRFVGRLFEFSISKNVNAIREMIPVLDLSGRPAMYDEVSGQLFYNQDTGEFTWGELET